MYMNAIRCRHFVRLLRPAVGFTRTLISSHSNVRSAWQNGEKRPNRPECRRSSNLKMDFARQTKSFISSSRNISLDKRIAQNCREENVNYFLARPQRSNQRRNGISSFFVLELNPLLFRKFSVWYTKLSTHHSIPSSFPWPLEVKVAVSLWYLTRRWSLLRWLPLIMGQMHL